MERLGLPKTLLGVDAVRDGALAGADLTEHDLLALAGEAPESFVVVTVIGGQGHIFGRGNQQISPAVLRRVGRDHVIVIATQTKLLSLEGRPLLVDTGDPALDEQLSGYTKVVTALGERTMYRVGSTPPLVDGRPSSPRRSSHPHVPRRSRSVHRAVSRRWS